MIRMLTIFAAGCWLAGAATAETGTWNGEGSLSAGINTGNTETSDLGIAVKMVRETQIWRTSAEVSADYGTKNGDRTKNRYFIAGQGDRTISDRLFGFGRLSHEEDEFSGFHSRSFVGGGLGYRVFDTDALNWTVDGGPGLKYDRVRSRLVPVPDGDPIFLPTLTDESLSFRGASRFSYTVNDNVRFGNDTSVIYADVSTQVGNRSTLTASLTKTLSARFSFEVRHDTAPQEGFEETDTATRMSLVYSFGG
ncbi:MAG: YdiY family protein [Hyphomonas sp.]